MPLTLVLGPANSAKAGEVLGAFAGAAARRGAVLVVPTSEDADAYAREGEAVFGAVLTPEGLMSEISRRLGLRQRRIGPYARARLLRRLTPTPGHADALGELVRELGRALVTPQRFAAAMGAIGAEEVGSLPLAYARELDRLGCRDAEGAAREALEALRREPAAWGADAVMFYGFDDLTGLERDAVETLSRVTEVHVSLTYEPGREALAARAEVAEALRPLAARVLELPALEQHYAPGSRAALHHLERGLFAAGATRVDPAGAVRVLEAGGERAEAELVAAEVAGLLADGVAPEEIVILARDPGAVAARFAGVFEAYGMTLAAPVPRMLRHTALGRAVRALARCAWAPDAGAEDLLGYLRAPGLLERPELADELEARLRRGAVRDLASARGAFSWELGEIDRLAGAGRPGEALLAQARRLFALPHRGRAPLLAPRDGLDARALATLAGAVGELEGVFGPCSPAELLGLLDELALGPSRAPRLRGGILLADPLSVRARRFRYVFVCDLQEGAFPRAGRPDPYLPDEVRFELARATGLYLRAAGDPLARERYLFYACVSRATERVTLSYRSSDEEGNLALPSPFLADVAELFDSRLLEERRRRLLADVVWPVGEAPTPREAERARAAASGGSALPPPEHRLGSAALARMRHTRMVSAGALELFATCPVRWLVERELDPAGLEPEPEPLARGNLIHGVLERLLRRLGEPLTPARLGRARELLDEEMARVELPVAAGASPGEREAARLRITADLRRYLAYEAERGPGWRPAALEWRFGFEQDPASAPALALGAGEGAVLVRGTVDRIDVDESGRRAIVRDYKSGSARPEQRGARWRQDDRLQVPLYMAAVQELLGLEAVAGVYQPLSGRDLRPRGVHSAGVGFPGEGFLAGEAREADALGDELDAAKARALELVARLRAGVLAPCPSKCSRDGCRHPGICRAG